MLYGQDRRALRELFVRAWRKERSGQPLEGVETLIAGVVRRHPEYHALLADDDSTTRDWSPEQGESNPFLHLSMHIAIEEGLMLDEPRGVRDRYRSLLAQFPDEHELQHRMMDCLGEMLWRAGTSGQSPDTRAYLECLERIARRS
jgi:hypothetical protein